MLSVLSGWLYKTPQVFVQFLRIPCVVTLWAQSGWSLLDLHEEQFRNDRAIENQEKVSLGPFSDSVMLYRSAKRTH
jgi:hypothetical protein